MIKVTIVGNGNVSYHLRRVFSETENVRLIQVLSSRSLDSDSPLSKNSKFMEEPDIYIIAVSDDAIRSIAHHFSNSKKLVVHTSGSVAIDVLPEGVRRGVFYPLQTFSREREVVFNDVPICLEASKGKDLELLKALSSSISSNVHIIDSEQRRALHIAAVFVNNFSNHLYQIGSQICQENKVSFDLLKPLIVETASKIQALDPIEAQTGPAKRHDTSIIEGHLKELKNEKHKAVYSILTESIQDIYGKKL